MMSNVSHEFRTPLNAIMTSDDFIRKRVERLRLRFPEHSDVFDDLDKWC